MFVIFYLIIGFIMQTMTCKYKTLVLFHVVMQFTFNKPQTTYGSRLSVCPLRLMCIQCECKQRELIPSNAHCFHSGNKSYFSKITQGHSLNNPSIMLIVNGTIQLVYLCMAKRFQHIQELAS